MAAAFDRAGFDAYDVHMSDIVAGRRRSPNSRASSPAGDFPTATCWGGRGLGQVDPVQSPRARGFCGVFRARRYVCARCMQRLPDDEQPARAHPRHGALAAFRAQRVGTVRGAATLVEVQETPSLFFHGMEGSRIPIVTAHGEGYAEFRDAAQFAAAQPWVTLRFVDNAAPPPNAIRPMPTARRRASPASPPRTGASPS